MGGDTVSYGFNPSPCVPENRARQSLGPVQGGSLGQRHVVLSFR